MEDIVLIGSGGLAREVRWFIEECNKEVKKWNVLGWISKEKSGTIISGLPVLGDDEWLMNYPKALSVALCVGDGALRKQLAEQYERNEKVSFPNIVAPNVSMSESVKLGCGCIVATQSVLTVDISIGNFFISNPASTVGHDCKIGDYVTLYPGAHVAGSVTLGEGSSIGTGASVIQGLSVGENTFIGAGAVVVRDIPANCVAVGIPAKPLEKKYD